MPPLSEWLARSPEDFVSFLQERGLRRFHFVTDPDTGRLIASHEILQPIADALQRDPRDFDAHEGMFFQVTRSHATLQGAFIHRTRRGQAAGGVRYWSYDTLEDFVRDGMRLAIGMGQKNALAGLWWGGGKGVMARRRRDTEEDPEVRASIYREYGEFISALRGCYVTAEDVGTSVEDMAEVFTTTRFTTCIPPALGGSGNPSVPTARGVVAGMEAALEFRENGTLEGRTIAVQGLGHVGAPLVGFLLERGVERVVACDIDAENVERARQQFRDRRFEAVVVDRDDLTFFDVECDVFAPCATGAVLRPETIGRIRAAIVCGAANNQLEDPARDDELLRARDILYVPDFLTNRMGIVHCADESAGSVPHDPLIERHLDRDWEHSIHRTCLRVLEEARRSGRGPAAVAIEQADRLSREPHPIFGHRGRQIIDALVRDRWYREG